MSDLADDDIALDVTGRAIAAGSVTSKVTDEDFAVARLR
jgi:hypothetical protein